MSLDLVGFKKASRFLIVWLPGLELFDQLFDPQDVYRTLQVVHGHNQGHFAIHFFQPFQVGVVVAPLAFDGPKEGQRKKLGSKLKMGFALGSKRSDAGYNFKPVFSSGIDAIF